MTAPTPEERAAWRVYAEDVRAHYAVAGMPDAERILALLDALDAAEQDRDIERHETSLVRVARGEALADLEFWRDRARSAEAALARVRALDTGYREGGGNRHAYCINPVTLRAVLNGEGA